MDLWTYQIEYFRLHEDDADVQIAVPSLAEAQRRRMGGGIIWYITPSGEKVQMV